MKAITRKQRQALFRVYCRTRLWLKNQEMTTSSHMAGLGEPLTYRQFRRLAEYTNKGFIMVPWCGVWLGIETDGYIHS